MSKKSKTEDLEKVYREGVAIIFFGLLAIGLIGWLFGGYGAAVVGVFLVVMAVMNPSSSI
jgi:hypothetical protein